MEENYVSVEVLFYAQPENEVAAFLRDIQSAANFKSFDLWPLPKSKSFGLTKEQAATSWEVWLYFPDIDAAEHWKDSVVLRSLLERQQLKYVAQTKKPA